MKYIAGFFFALMLLAGCSAVTPHKQAISSVPAVPIMPGVTPDMHNAGFWISRADAPDMALMTSQEIQEFNLAAAEKWNILRISEYPDNQSGIVIKKSILSLFTYMASQTLYTSGGQKAGKKYMDKIRAMFRLEELDSTVYPTAFGMITENVSQRVLPTEEVLGKINDRGMFDRLQMSSLPIGTPVAVLWGTADRGWLFVRSPLTIGWVKADTVSYTSREEIQTWEETEDFYVTVRHKTALYADTAMLSYITWAPMGVRLPMADGTALLPRRDDEGRLFLQKVYAEEGAFHKGYVNYTSRNMLKLAFEMLNAPYGWGGMFGEQDCSGFLMQIFSAAGVFLPRNSAQQGQTGELIYSKFYDVSPPARQSLVFFGIPGATLIQLPGHIMLYVGKLNGEPYAIHALWAFEELKESRPALRLPARVAVSDLNLGAHSEKGPYIGRAVNIRNITVPSSPNSDAMP